MIIPRLDTLVTQGHNRATWRTPLGQPRETTHTTIPPTLRNNAWPSQDNHGTPQDQHLRMLLIYNSGCPTATTTDFFKIGRDRHDCGEKFTNVPGIKSSNTPHVLEGGGGRSKAPRPTANQVHVERIHSIKPHHLIRTDIWWQILRNTGNRNS